jgi:hypothetical protein
MITTSLTTTSLTTHCDSISGLSPEISVAARGAR